MRGKKRTMSKLLVDNKKDEKINEIKLSVERFLLEISSTQRQLFSCEEIENILLDIYNKTR
jgi:hypothetical protein